MPPFQLSLKIYLDISGERIHMQNNNIIEFLDLEDPDIIVTDITTTDMQKVITIESVPSKHFCPVCRSRMYSRGIKTRTVHHPILQDGFDVILKVRQRRWRCINSICEYETNESFRFVNKGRRYTNASDMLIVNEFRRLTRSARDIARQFNTTDSNVLNIFDRYVDMKRLPLTDAISLDEVYLDMDENCKYTLVIQDFHTGNTIDILPSRRSNVTLPYFANIPKEERFAVKYLISDMYNEYLDYPRKYFPNAVSVVDSFHVIQWLNHSIDEFLRSLWRDFKDRDMQRKQQLELEAGRSLYIPLSDEIYLLQNYKWLMLKNQSNINYHYESRIDKHFHYLMNTFDYEQKFYDIHPDLREIHYLKEEYIRFNERNAGSPDTASVELDELIARYKSCGYEMFQTFARLLQKHRDAIINSFIMVEKIGVGNLQYETRLSNGPIESLNRKAKDLKRQGRGYRNFGHLRNRFLFATRANAPLNGREEEPQPYVDCEE